MHGLYTWIKQKDVATLVVKQSKQNIRGKNVLEYNLKVLKRMLLVTFLLLDLSANTFVHKCLLCYFHHDRFFTL